MTKLEKITDFLEVILHILLISIIHLIMFAVVFFMFYQGIAERDLFYFICGVIVLVPSLYALLITIQYRDTLLMMRRW